VRYGKVRYVNASPFYIEVEELLGYYQLSALPLKISDFPLSGRKYDYIRVCIKYESDCCEEIEFMPPDC